MDLNKNNVKKILGIITFTLILMAVLLNFSAVGNYLMFLWGIVLPFVVGGAIAFILNIPMSAIEKQFQKIQIKTKRGEKIRNRVVRPVSMVLAILLVFLIIGIVIGVVVPQLGQTINSIGESMTKSLPKIQIWLEQTFQDQEEIVKYIKNLDFDWKNWLNTIKDFAWNGAGSVLSYTMSATMMVVNGVMSFFIAFIFALYILSQKENLGRQSRKLITAVFSQKIVEKILSVCSLSYKTFSRFITGQCLEAMILGAMFFVTMSIFRLPYALLVGVLIAFTALIPIVGAFIGCFVGALLILMVNPMQAVFFVILFLILQQVEGNLVYPHVVGNSVGLPSIWVLFAVTVGGKLMGVMGMLVFIPLFSVLYALLREWINYRIFVKKA
ncbi:AI-2E family transporter [Roseburia sp. 499]|uniref:AI-2E family transporter n=1 Tax=Roseburia sp. 499 TaxID=1261634 RepID=UPI000950E5FD|nr:AI-2E family transporter [Roseburia sp. 499]WVK69654.1 AI-2E family transporter [Roseburia sp. 499]